MSTITTQVYIGPQISDVIQDIARLRIAVFREYPYLYEGDEAYERKYLKRYPSSARAFVAIKYDGDTPIGATTACPMSDEDFEFQQPFIEAGYDISKIFYFGESILLPAYRGRGFGHEFFDLRENHARSFNNSYNMATFCSVDRPIDHPKRPKGYAGHDAFWHKRGYQRQESLVCSLEWQEIGDLKESTHTLTFYTKQI